jgi:transcription elongation factor SPT5
MIHQSFLNKSFKDVRYTYSRWACATAARHVLSLYPKREPDEPQFWVEQAFSITAGICLILDLFHRTEINAEAQEYLACVKRAVVYLASFPTSSVANHGVRVLTSLLQEYTKKVEATKASVQTRPNPQAQTTQPPQLPQGMQPASLAEAGLLPPSMPSNPDISLSSETAGPFNFDIDMMEFEDLLDGLPTEIGVDNNAFYDSMLSAANGSYNLGW